VLLGALNIPISGSETLLLSQGLIATFSSATLLPIHFLECVRGRTADFAHGGWMAEGGEGFKGEDEKGGRRERAKSTVNSSAQTNGPIQSAFFGAEKDG
jgi:hypothetical protein